MIRYTLFTVAVLILSIYAWRDWYKALCGLIVVIAAASYSGVPRALFGITGLSPFNFLIANILLAWLYSYKREGLSWDLPRGINILLVIYMAIVLIAILRFPSGSAQMDEVFQYIPGAAPSRGNLLISYFFDGIKWLLPSVLLFTGCNSRNRLNWAILALMAMHLVLALFVIRLMPIELLADGDALQRRAMKELGMEIGFYRTNLSVMLAGIFWVFVVARNYFPRKYGLLIMTAAFVVLLGMFLTGGRGGYLAWAVMGLIFSFVKWRRYIVLAPMLFLLIIAVVPSVQDRVLHGVDQFASGPSYSVDNEEALRIASSGRTVTWPKVVEKSAERPLTGYGFNGIVTSGVTMQLINEYDITFFHPHNAYLQLIIDNGILGTLPILVLFAIILRSAWSLFLDSKHPAYVLAGGAAMAMVLTFLVAGLTGQSFYPEARSAGMWCTIALMARIAIQRHKLGRPVSRA